MEEKREQLSEVNQNEQLAREQEPVSEAIQQPAAEQENAPQEAAEQVTEEQASAEQASEEQAREEQAQQIFDADQAKKKDEDYRYRWSYEEQRASDLAGNSKKPTRRWGILIYALTMTAAFGLCFCILIGVLVIGLIKMPASNQPVQGGFTGDVTVVGGKLPELGYKTIDLLQDPMYLAENANITAHCAVKLAMNRLPVILQDQPVMIVGWGRIGKCLASLLKRLGAQVWVYARKETDRAMLQALGYGIGELTDTDRYRVIFNTVPTLLLPQIHSRCLKIDLASTPGIAGEDVIHARGLPGKEAAQSSGELIARRLLHLMKGDLL